MECVVVTGDHGPVTTEEPKRPRIILVGMDPGIDRIVIQRLTDAYKCIGNLKIMDLKTAKPGQIGMLSDFHCDDYDDRDCKLDHGERTNYKLKDQPFYMRGRNGKMRGW